MTVSLGELLSLTVNRLPKTLQYHKSGLTHAFSVLGFVAALETRTDLSTVFSSPKSTKVPYVTTVPIIPNTNISITPPDRVTTALLHALKRSDEHAFFHATNHATHSYNFSINLGLSAQEVNELYYASLLHDIGKVFFADLIKLPRKLTSEEYQEVLKHTIMSFIILSACEFPRLVVLSGLFHHLSYDKKNGYPLPNDELVKTINFIAKSINFPAPNWSVRDFNEVSTKEWDHLSVLVLLDSLDAAIDPNRTYKSPLELSQVAKNFETAPLYSWEHMFNPALKPTFLSYLEWLTPFVASKRDNSDQVPLNEIDLGITA